jgi:hypothetical protein
MVLYVYGGMVIASASLVPGVGMVLARGRGGVYFGTVIATT